MSNEIVVEIGYIQHRTYIRLLDGLASVAAGNGYREFQALEIDLACAKEARDFFSIEERRVIFEVLKDEGYPPLVLSGGYIDGLESIVIEANLILKDAILSNGKSRECGINDGDEIKELWGQVILVCQYGINDFLGYMEAANQDEEHNQLKGDWGITAEFLRYKEERDREFLRQLH